MTRINIRSFDTLEQASEALAFRVCAKLADAIAQRDFATLAVPGGTTPALFLKRLGRMDLDWSKVILMPTDERQVSANHERSNERMIRASFKPLEDGICRFISFCPDIAGKDTNLEITSYRISDLAPLDVVICGMGEDGHIASLFPDDLSWMNWQDVQLPALILTHPPNLEKRASLSPDILLSARYKALLISGSAKIQILEHATSHGSSDRFPVYLWLDAPEPPTVYAVL